MAGRYILGQILLSHATEHGSAPGYLVWNSTSKQPTIADKTPASKGREDSLPIQQVRSHSIVRSIHIAHRSKTQNGERLPSYTKIRVYVKCTRSGNTRRMTSTRPHATPSKHPTNPATRHRDRHSSHSGTNSSTASKRATQRDRHSRAELRVPST